MSIVECNNSWQEKTNPTIRVISPQGDFNFFPKRPMDTMKWVSRVPLSLLLLLLLSRFSCVRLCATPQMAAHKAPPSLGFSRQEHWTRLPFPSPMHESEKWKWSRSFVSDSLQPHGLQPTRLLCPWDFPGKSLGVWKHEISSKIPWRIF